MNKIISIVLLVGAVAVGAGVLNTHDRLSQTSGQAKGNLFSVSEDIHNLRQLDGEWSLSVLRSLVTDSDFDEVAGFLPRLRELRADLGTAADAEDNIPDNLKNRLFRFLSLIESKEETVEQFKTNFAVMRNSRKFLPVATRSLLASAAQLDAPKATEDGKKAVESTVGKGLANKIRDIGDRVSSFTQRPDEGAKVRVLTLLSEFEETVLQYPPELSNALNNYISHSRIIMERTIHLNGILKRVLGTEVAEAGTELSTQFKNFSASLVSEVESGTANLNKQLLMMILGLAAIAIVSGIMYAISAFSVDKKIKASVAKATEGLEKEMENNASKAGSGTDMGSVSAMASTIAEEIGNPVGKLSESLDAIRSSAERFGTLKTEVDKLMHTKSADTFEMMSNLKNIGEVLENVSGDATLNDVPEALDEMQNNIMHVQAFTGELRNLSNSEPKEKAWFNVNDTVNAAVEEMQSKVGDGVTIKAKTATVPEVFGSSEEMQHTVVSMIHNAVDAIRAAGQAKGQIMISTKKHNDRAIISVVDNGQGMDDETRSHVFEPFFSTKERGNSKVSGLGLSVAQRMVVQNDGKIVIKSIPGKGTNFSIVLPLKSNQEAAQA
ncbi:MAG: HAMP domain-containing histidine kinase [Gammaproteobacteria bacterium]|nr:HAMP domain-containing histidine kinase [Gammaproteobacteria bacterium]